ncbi:sugar transferase [Riemerella columbina]|uniref:sugar transferase n=1 Tax=Riemerella columbina TaxID=103810 RepID=UPI000476A600|nr:sugar transferase [Riemerella columbina]
MQKTRYSRYIRPLFITADLLMLMIYFYGFIKKPLGNLGLNWENYLLFMLVAAAIWILVSGYSKVYHVPRTLTYTRHMERVFKQLIFFAILMLVLEKLSSKINFEERRYITVGALMMLFVVFKTITYSSLKYYRSLGKNHRNVMFLFEDEMTSILKQTIKERTDYGYKIFEYHHPLEDIEKLATFWRQQGIDVVFLPSEAKKNEDLIKCISQVAEKYRVELNFVPNVLYRHFSQYELRYFEAIPVLVPTRYPLDFFSQRLLKRGFDILFSILFLILIGTWLFPILALLIWWDSGKPILFVQERYGQKLKVFPCIKFRTMSSDEQLPSEKRVTKIGRWLRKTSLDETPQFINVLLGQMSVVGPRPHMLSVDNFYEPKIEHYKMRSLVKPGITGLAQVNGLRGDGDNVDLRMEKRALMDMFYIKNWSVGLDMVIILKTLILMTKGDENAQ